MFSVEESKLYPTVQATTSHIDSSGGSSSKAFHKIVDDFSYSPTDKNEKKGKKRKRREDSEERVEEKPKKKVAISRSAASLAKVDTSKMKSIASFFKKK
jgi:hypothetical protein